MESELKVEVSYSQGSRSSRGLDWGLCTGMQNWLLNASSSFNSILISLVKSYFQITPLNLFLLLHSKSMGVL